MKWHCDNCGELEQGEVTEKTIGDQSQTLCNLCRQRVPRIIDLTQPMPCIVSVRVTEDMEENGDIPY